MKCMVLFCKNAGKIPGISYFSLTSNRHDTWMRAMGRDPTMEHLSVSNRVCSDHFLDEDKFIKKNIWKLKPGAVPVLKLVIRPFMPIKENIERKPEEMPDASYIEEENSKGQEQWFLNEYKENEISSISGTLQEGSNSSSFLIPELPVASPGQSLLKRKGTEYSSSNSQCNKRESKRARRGLKLIHNYSSSPEKILVKLKKSEANKKVFKKKIRLCQRCVQRLTKKGSSLKQVVSEFK